LLGERPNAGIVVTELPRCVALDEFRNPYNVRVAEAELVVRPIATNDDVFGHSGVDASARYGNDRHWLVAVKRTGSYTGLGAVSSLLLREYAAGERRYFTTIRVTG
jgi:hypothetical protein